MAADDAINAIFEQLDRKLLNDYIESARYKHAAIETLVLEELVCRVSFILQLKDFQIKNLMQTGSYNQAQI